MSGVDELIAFLTRCLDDDERVTRQMMAEPGGFYIEAETPSVNILAIGAHVYRWTPKRVLAEVEAKRRVLAEYANARHMERVTHETDDPGKWEWLARSEALERVVQMLAQPYAGQDGWREEWQLSTPA